jgi:hypothetical protein
MAMAEKIAAAKVKQVIVPCFKEKNFSKCFIGATDFLTSPTKHLLQ